MIKQSRGPSTSAAAIVNHPVRLRCWLALSQTPASPAELARRFGVATNDTDYHIKKLCEMGIAEKVGERPVRGVTESFYVAVRNDLDEEAVAGLTKEASIAHATAITQLAFADVALSLDTGKLAERTDHMVMRVPMVVDEEGWKRLSDLYEELLDDVLEVQAESAERMASDPDRRPIDATALGYLFEKPEPTT